MKLRVLVADDSILFRRVMAEALSSMPDVEVVGSVPNGQLALKKVSELKPDLLTLDMEMPEMDGLAVLEALRRNNEEVAVIVVSALTLQGGRLTMQALEKGAFDFITKPDTSSAVESRAAIRAELEPRLRAVASRLQIRQILRNKKPAAPAPPPAPPAPPPARPLDQVAVRMARIAAKQKIELALIGVSTGGPNALAKVIPALPGDIGVPILIVQHMPPVFTKSLAESLDAKSAVKVVEGAEGMLLDPNVAYIAPGGRHMRIAASPSGSPVPWQVQLTDDPPENHCRPAVDYLFRSASHLLPGRSVAVILTGMGNDGTLGLQLLKRHGCYVIAQNEESCVVYGMPKSAVDAGVVDVALPLEEIAPRLVAAIQGKPA